MNRKLVKFIQDVYGTKEFIPLHAPTFSGNEKAYVGNTIDSTFVSSVGKYVNDFEAGIEQYTGCTKAVAVVNGTAALHVALYMAGVKPNDLVITQALTFVATCNALHHMGASPVFIDVSRESLGLCPRAVDAWLEENSLVDEDGYCCHKLTRQRVSAVVPMHTFGHPVEIDELQLVCEKWSIPLVEDAAESLGSFYKGRHTGTLSRFSALSFNGNKIITTGGGGMILCQTINDGDKTKHITTTAKVPHPYDFFHDEPAFNYRMPNLNAALGCAQLEVLPQFIGSKRKLALLYKDFFADSDFQFIEEPSYAKSNYWLNAVICTDEEQRNQLLKDTNDAGVMTRPVWKLMHRLPMFADCFRGDLSTSEWVEENLVNLPSSPYGDINA